MLYGWFWVEHRLEFTDLNEWAGASSVFAVVEIHVFLFLDTIVDGIMLPELRGANTKFGMHVRLIPEDHVLEFIGAGRIIDDETFVIFGTLVHDLTEEVEIGECRAEVVEDTLTIRDEIFTENEDEIHVCTKNRWNTKRILHCNDEENLLVTAIKENIANKFVVDPRVVVETIVHNKERTWIETATLHDGAGFGHTFASCFTNFLCDELLAFDEICNNSRAIFSVNKHGGNNCPVETVGFFRTTDDGSHGKVAVMP